MKKRKDFSILFLTISMISLGLFNSCKKDNQGSETKVIENNVNQSNEHNHDVQTENMYTFLTNGYWMFKHRILINEEYQGNPYKDHWLKMHTDYRFERGKFDEVLYEGKYKYDHDKTLIHFIPDDPRVEPQSEWKVLHAVDAMVFQGTHRFGNNSEQIKLENVKSPTKEDQ